MSSTLDRDALPKTFSRRMRSRFSGTEAFTSQWESSVFVSSSKALALMILDVYGGGADDESPFLPAFRTAMISPRILPTSEQPSPPNSRDCHTPKRPVPGQQYRISTVDY